MEVQRTPLLELRDLAVRQPGRCLQLALREAGAGGDFTAEPVGEALPELSGVVVEQHRARVVVRLRVEGRTEGGIFGGVASAASADAPVRAVVHAAERGCGEGGEDAGMVADGGRDVAAVVPGEPGAYEVVGVARVRPGARWAAGGPAVAAGEAESPARFPLGGVVVQCLAGRLVLVQDPAGQVDGVGTAAGAAYLLVPAVVVRGRSHPQQVAEGGTVEQLLRHGRPPGRGGCG
jgi:hypothetical protein